MFSMLKILDPGDSTLLNGQLIERIKIAEINKRLKSTNKKIAKFEEIILGIPRMKG